MAASRRVQQQALLQTREVLPRGGMASLASPRRLPRRVKEGDHGPFQGSRETLRLCSGNADGLGVRALWGQQWTRLAKAIVAKYCHNGGMASAPAPAQTQPLAMGVHDRHLWPPLRHPQKLLICRGIS